MISVADARALIQQHVAGLEIDLVSLDQARGRVLRETIFADADQPPFDRSAMDGYALAELAPFDPTASYRLVGSVPAGKASDLSLRPGQAARIFTGAAVPAGATRVIPQENIVRDPAREHIIQIKEWPEMTLIRQQGQDILAGEELLGPSRILDAVDSSILASVGHTWVQVSRRPRVMHLTTGDEIISPEQTPEPGQIRNTNQILIRGLVEKAGARLVAQRHCGDHPEELINTIRACVEPYDLLLISGGASVGDYDFTAPALESLGYDLQFRQVDVRPGKPLIFATLSGANPGVAFGLPGNPVSHLVTFRVFVEAALDRFLQVDRSSSVRRAPLAEDVPQPFNNRETFWPARFTTQGEFQSLPWQSSGHLASLVEANALIRVPAKISALPKGQIVEGWML